MTCLPLVVQREGKHALRPLFDQRAVRSAASDLTDGGVQVKQPVLRDESSRAESYTRSTRACVRIVDRVS